MADVGAILRCLADLAPGGGERLDVTVGDFAWLGTEHWPHGADTVGVDVIPTSDDRSIRLPDVHALAQLDAIHGTLPILRLGWVYLSATVPRPGGDRRILVPLVDRPVRLAGSRTTFVGRDRYRVVPLGPWDLSPLVPDDSRADWFEGHVPFGGTAITGDPDPSPELLRRLPELRRWITGVCRAMGVTDVSTRGPIDPRQRRDVERPLAIVGFGLHAALDVSRLDARSSLLGWSTQPMGPTALDLLYGTAPAPSPPPDPSPVGSSVVLSAAQEEVVRRARTEPVVVVSGPPGTGKSHTAVAVALDAVARGQTVLMATRTAEAADVLAALLERGPGPDPVLFGGGGRARRLASALAEGLRRPADDGAGARHEAAWGRWTGAAAAVDRVLHGVGAWEMYDAVVAEVPAHREVARAWFGAGVDLDEAEALLSRAEDRAGGWAWWARRALAEVRAHAGAGAVSLVRLREALDVARVRAGVAGVVPTVSEARWDALAHADDAVRVAAGEALGAAVRARTDGPQTRAVAALATALRSGRGQRRRHLRSVDAAHLTHALPLWVGTLGDIEELLPQVPGMFDLVVLDEASQIDQPVAALALLRARRAVVVGDPNQLRFVSFLADREVRTAVERHGLEAVGDRLDVRRVSAFDLAAGAAPVTFLDEHFRGPPHLVGFSARRIYGGRLVFATRHPATEGADLIEVRSVDGSRTEDGPNRPEVDAVMETLVDHLEAAATVADPPSVGVVTPFRAQAEAVLAAVRERWTVDDIERVRLRVGTVHAFQGDERDVVVLSLAVGPDGTGLRFVEDRHLFNVMVTRARRRMVVVSSCPEPREGMLRDYLRWAASPPPVPVEVGAPPAEPWAGAVAAALGAGGVAHRVGYPVGRERIDLVVGEGAAAVGVELGVHPDGPGAHRRRHLALRRAGWQLVDAFPARFDGDPTAAAVELGTIVGRRPTP